MIFRFFLLKLMNKNRYLLVHLVSIYSLKMFAIFVQKYVSFPHWHTGRFFTFCLGWKVWITSLVKTLFSKTNQAFEAIEEVNEHDFDQSVATNQLPILTTKVSVMYSSYLSNDLCIILHEHGRVPYKNNPSGSNCNGLYRTG